MLNDIDKKNPFKVPENYFTDFHAAMMSRIAREPAAKIVPLWRKPSSWAAVAAAVVGVILLASIFNSANTDLQTAKSDADTALIDDKTLASNTSNDEDFYLYLENQVAQQSYYSAVNF
ncbi:MAG: hypothetical protein LBR34_05905 [Prevotella sp.]|jgi:hypothetical protein|nr:hypothetical protein [Prevotella sp.]